MKMRTPLTSCCLLLSVFSIPAAAESAAELIAKGNYHAGRFEERDALKYYLEAERHDRENVGLLVAISREYRHMMSGEGSDADKVKYGKLALDYALRAAALSPTDPEAQLAPGITYGKILRFTDGSGDKLEISRSIKVSVDKTIELDATNDTAWHVLGCWHRGLAQVGGVKRLVGGLVYGKLPKSTYEDSATCFRRAIEINPKRPMHFIELGIVYEAMGRDDEAKKYIEHGLVLADTDKDDPDLKRRGREVLRKL